MELVEDGWLAGVRRVASPNCDARPQEGDISLIVVHGISLPPGEYGGPWIDDLFTNRLDPDAHAYFRDIQHLRVSSHVLIRRDGSLVQYVPFARRAWHAGASCHDGRECCNDFSIGIELEGTDEDPYSDAQYQALSALLRTLMKAYPGVTPQRIVGHSDIAPGRKTDPGAAFQWPRLYALLAADGSTESLT